MSKKREAQRTRTTLADTAEVLKDTELRHGHKVLWLGYRLRDYDGKGTFVHDETIARDVGMSARAVQRFRKVLLKLGYLTQQKRGPETALYRAVLPVEVSPEVAKQEQPEVSPIVAKQGEANVSPFTAKQGTEVSPVVSPVVSPLTANRIRMNTHEYCSEPSLRSVSGADAPTESEQTGEKRASTAASDEAENDAGGRAGGMRVEGTDSNPSEALTETDSSGVEAFTLTAGDDYAHECWWAALSDVARFRVTQATKGGTGALTYYKLTPEQRREFERAGW